MLIANRCVILVMLFTALTTLLVGAALLLGQGIKSREIAFVTWVEYPDQSALSFLDIERNIEHRFLQFPIWDYFEWSPDGTHFLTRVRASRESNGELYVYDLQTPQMFTPAQQEFAANPTWSPDSQSIAFRDTAGTLMVMDVRGGNKQSLTTPYHIRSIAWSPDGRWIAYGSYDEIRIRNSVTGENSRIKVNDGSYLDSMVWSPDSTKIAFTLFYHDQGWMLHVVDVTGENMRTLTDHFTRTRIMGFNWSSDNQRIVFNSDRDNNADIYMVDVVSEQLTRLTSGMNLDWCPRWTSDGSRIAFISCSLRQGCDIFVMDADGGNLTQMTHHGRVGRPDFLAWRPP